MFDLHLPTIEIIAGDTCPFEFQVQSTSKLDISASSCTAYFSISDYVNETDEPIFSTEASGIKAGILTFDVEPSHTVNLRGKYVYQLILSNGEQSEIYSGYLIVYANRNKSPILK